MRRRDAEEWRALFEAQARSGKPAAAFCREHGLCPKYFSLRKKALGRAPIDSPPPFVRVEREPAAQVETPARAVRLRLGRCEWELCGLTFDELARLMQALA